MSCLSCLVLLKVQFWLWRGLSSWISSPPLPPQNKKTPKTRAMNCTVALYPICYKFIFMLYWCFFTVCYKQSYNPSLFDRIRFKCSTLFLTWCSQCWNRDWFSILSTKNRFRIRNRTVHYVLLQPQKHRKGTLARFRLNCKVTEADRRYSTPSLVFLSSLKWGRFWRKKLSYRFVLLVMILMRWFHFMSNNLFFNFIGNAQQRSKELQTLREKRKNKIYNKRRAQRSLREQDTRLHVRRSP